MPEPPQPGTLVLVVGPSGAGKDTLIAQAARTFPAGDLVIARRIVTRESSDAEDHDVLAPAAFAEARAQGRFAACWQAHGLDYAVPRSIEAKLAEGAAVLCNVSRAVVPDLRARYPHCAVIYVDAPLAVRRARVAGRRRPGETPARAERSGALGPGEADYVVDNGESLAEGCARFDAVMAAILESVRSRRAPPAGK